MTAVAYQMFVNGAPFPPELLEGVQQIEAEDHADLADMLRLRFAMAVSEGKPSWSVLDEDLFPRLASVSIRVRVGSAPAETLITAYVIESNADFANEPGQSVLSVVALDPTSLMNLEEKVREWPDMADSDIASTIFGEYGFDPVVETTSTVHQETDLTTMQRGTDIRFLLELAERNGFECYVETDPATGRPQGHFHPPRHEEKPQGVLSVNLGDATNVNAFRARYDMLRPTTVETKGLEAESVSDQPAGAESLDKRGLGSEPATPTDRPRRILLSQTGLVRTGELQTYAQAVVNESALAITAEGELSTAAYGGILRAKRPVLVRGAGKQFSGTYYVQKVLHMIAGDTYTQKFTLRRNALGRTGQESFVEDNALAS